MHPRPVRATRSAASSSWPTSPARSGSLLARQEVGPAGRHPARRLPELPRPERAGLVQGRPVPRRLFLDKVAEPDRRRGPRALRQIQGRPARPDRADARLQGPPPGQGRVLSIDVGAGRQADQGEAPRGGAEVATTRPARRPSSRWTASCPADLFLGEPKLTPPRYVPFAEVRESWPAPLAREKANEEILETFGTIRDEVVDKFADKYQDIVDDIAEAKKEGAADRAVRRCPSPRTWPAWPRSTA